MIDIRSRKIIANVKGKEIPFEEYYAFDLETNEEVFERNLELKNDLRLYDLYKESEGLLTSSDIKKIRNKYQMNQKEFALALGMGEITIHRFENGSIQTEAIDSVIRLSDDPKIMNNFLVKNKDSFEETDYKRLIDNVSDLIKLSEHKVTLFNKKDFAEYNFETSDALVVADYLINAYNEKVHNTLDKVDIDEKEFYITPLKLQKLLYYIQGLSSVIKRALKAQTPYETKKEIILFMAKSFELLNIVKKKNTLKVLCDNINNDQEFVELLWDFRRQNRNQFSLCGRISRSVSKRMHVLFNIFR